MTKKEYNHKWYLRNRKLTIARSAKWSQAHPRRRRLYKLRWEAKTPIHKRRSYLRKWAAANPEKVSGYHRKLKYGLTSKRFEEMRQRQGNKCAICRVTFAKTPHVDHCHASGKIRSLLCARCNWIIGYAHEDERVLLAAAQYLRKYNAKNI